jgi:hypothetical protein
MCLILYFNYYSSDYIVPFTREEEMGNYIVPFTREEEMSSQKETRVEMNLRERNNVIS